MLYLSKQHSELKLTQSKHCSIFLLCGFGLENYSYILFLFNIFKICVHVDALTNNSTKIICNVLLMNNCIHVMQKALLKQINFILNWHLENLRISDLSNLGYA